MRERRFGGDLRAARPRGRGERDQTRVAGRHARRVLRSGLAVVVFGLAMWAAGGILEVAYQQARDYLFNQLRTEYINSKRNRSYGYLAATALGGPPVWLGMSIAIAADAAQYGVNDPVWLPNTARWSAQVNAELLSAQGEIDRIHAVNAQSCKDRLDAATTQAADAANARLAAEEKLIRLRGDYPDVTFPGVPV